MRVYAAPAPSADGTLTPTAHSRDGADVAVYGWTPWDFVREGLLQYLVSEEDDRNTQVGMLEQRCRLQLARWAYPYGSSGAVLLRDPGDGASYVFDRVVAEHRDRRRAAADRRRPSSRTSTTWSNSSPARSRIRIPSGSDSIAHTTQWAFLRRLYGKRRASASSSRPASQRVNLETGAAISVVDISSLHDAAQRFVVGALLSAVFADKAARGREPLRFIVLDELNKYAPAQGTVPDQGRARRHRRPRPVARRAADRRAAGRRRRGREHHPQRRRQGRRATGRR